MQTRRLVAVAIVVVLVVAAALLIHGCQVSQTNDSLKTYAGSVSSLITHSDSNGATVFKDLKSGEGASDETTLGNQLTSALQTASSQLTQAKDLSAPDQMATAQQSFVETMQLRYQGISQIADNIQGALNKSTAEDSVDAITAGTSMLYASDVVYKTSVVTGIAAALNSAKLAIGGTAGVNINAGQVVSDLGWLNAKTVAVWLGASVPSAQVNTDQPGLHGHSLNSVSVGTNSLSTAVTNTITASPAPTFTLSVTNSGQYDELEVECKVSVKGLNDAGTATIPETTPGQTTTCSVTLPSPPTQGNYTVTAEVVPVLGETNTANNILKFPVTFN